MWIVNICRHGILVLHFQRNSFRDNAVSNSGKVSVCREIKHFIGFTSRWKHAGFAVIAAVLFNIQAICMSLRVNGFVVILRSRSDRPTRIHWQKCVGTFCQSTWRNIAQIAENIPSFTLLKSRTTKITFLRTYPNKVLIIWKIDKSTVHHSSRLQNSDIFLTVPWTLHNLCTWYRIIHTIDYKTTANFIKWDDDQQRFCQLYLKLYFPNDFNNNHNN